MANNTPKCTRHCRNYTKLLVFINLSHKVVFLNIFVMGPVKMDPFFLFVMEKMHHIQSLPYNLRGTEAILGTRLRMPPSHRLYTLCPDLPNL